MSGLKSGCTPTPGRPSIRRALTDSATCTLATVRRRLSAFIRNRNAHQPAAVSGEKAVNLNAWVGRGWRRAAGRPNLNRRSLAIRPPRKANPLQPNATTVDVEVLPALEAAAIRPFIGEQTCIASARRSAGVAIVHHRVRRSGFSIN